MKKSRVQLTAVSLSLISLFFVLTSCSDDLGKAPTLDIYTGSIEIEGYEGGDPILLNSTETKQIIVQISPNVGSDLTAYSHLEFSSSDEKVFTVSESGELQGYHNGEANLMILAHTDLIGDQVETVKPVRVSGQVMVQEIKLDEKLQKGVLLREDGELDLREHILVAPQNALNKNLSFKSSDESIVRVENNTLYAGNGGEAVISVQTTDGTNLESKFTVSVVAPINIWYDKERSGWSIINSHDIFFDINGASGNSKDLIDGNILSFINMKKPGKDESIGADEILYFTIDTGEALKVNRMEFQHRLDNTFARIRLWGFDLEGSNDGVTYTSIEKNLRIPGATIKGIMSLKGTVLFQKSFEYRYLRVICNFYDEDKGESIQIAEVRLGYDEALDPEAS